MQVLPVSGTSMRTLSVSSTASNFIVAALNANTSHIYWTLEGADIRLTIDGSTPTTTAGHIFKDGNSGIFTISELNYT